jgi:hypothetical protein
MTTPVTKKPAAKKPAAKTAAKVAKKEESTTTFTEETAEQAEAAQVDAVAPQPESIGLEDLKQIVAIVDIASQRGSFRGAELEQVGAVYNKVSRFLAYVEQAQKQAMEQQGQ